MPVATKTQSVTNTKLALATAALLAASGLALAFLPGSGLGERCGVNAAKYANDGMCPSGLINSMDYTCLGDKKKNVRSISGRCVNPKEYKKAANKECCNAPTGRCGDSDGGLNTEVAGWVEYEIRSSEVVEVVDRCDTRDPNRILEAYCAEDGEGKISRLPCRDGSVCQDIGRGAECVAPEPEPVEITCEDSDSNIQGEVGLYDYNDPMSYFVTGTVRVSGMSEEVSDWCSASGLLEMYCQEDGSFLNHHVVCEGRGAECVVTNGQGRCECLEGLYLDGRSGSCVSEDSCTSGTDENNRPFIANEETGECHVCEGDTVPNSGRDACVCPTGREFNISTGACEEDRQDGEPVEVQCEDSDSEEPGRYINSYFVPGSTTGIAYSDTPTLGEYGFTFGEEAQRDEEVTLLDTCLGESFIFEMACGEGDADNRVVWINHLDCADYGATCQTNDVGEGYCVCPEGQEFNINTGACEETPEESQQREGLSHLQDTSTCIDSDSNILSGNDRLSYFVTGTISGVDVGGNSYEYSDICTSVHILGEVYCDNSNGTLLGNTSQVNCENYGATCENSNGLGSCACPTGQEFDPETEECSL